MQLAVSVWPGATTSRERVAFVMYTSGVVAAAVTVTAIDTTFDSFDSVRALVASALIRIYLVPVPEGTLKVMFSDSDDTPPPSCEISVPSNASDVDQTWSVDQRYSAV